MFLLCAVVRFSDSVTPVTRTKEDQVHTVQGMAANAATSGVPEIDAFPRSFLYKVAGALVPADGEGCARRQVCALDGASAG